MLCPLLYDGAARRQLLSEKKQQGLHILCKYA